MSLACHNEFNYLHCLTPHMLVLALITHHTFSHSIKGIGEEVRKSAMAYIPHLIKSLNLLSRVCAIDSEAFDIISAHPKLFHGLGNLKGEYRIQLRSDAQPFALSTPRRVAIPRMSKIKKELEAMEKSGIISKVNQPTDWCYAMVVIPKNDGRVRICVDLTKLNESVK